MLNRRALKRRSTAVAVLPICLGVSAAVAEPVPGGTLDPLTIPKYVTPLLIPPVLYDDRGGRRPIDGVVAQRQITQQVLPAGFPATPLWAYGNPRDPASFNNPAFTIEVTKDCLLYTSDAADDDRMVWSSGGGGGV